MIEYLGSLTPKEICCLCYVKLYGTISQGTFTYRYSLSEGSAEHGISSSSIGNVIKLRGASIGTLYSL